MPARMDHIIAAACLVPGGVLGHHDAWCVSQNIGALHECVCSTLVVSFFLHLLFFGAFAPSSMPDDVYNSVYIPERRRALIFPFFVPKPQQPIGTRT